MATLKKSTTTPKKSPAGKAAPTPAAERPAPQPGGRVLKKEPFELPLRPEHHYGRITLASALQPGDVLYTGDQRRLNTVEVLTVTPEKTQPARHVLIEVAAISLQLEGREYTERERVYLRAGNNSSVAVRSFVG
jgi:hypothetical protein